MKWPLQLLHLRGASFIPTLSALFTSIYFWFKCCKMKVRSRAGGWECRGETVAGGGDRQVALFCVAGPPGGAVSALHAGGAMLSPLLT